MRQWFRATASSMVVFVIAANLGGCAAAPQHAGVEMAPLAGPGECVILLHGLARTESSMSKMRAALIDHHYLVASLTYPSRELPIDSLSLRAIPGLIQTCRDQGAQKIHFVTHSLGGILVRDYLQTEALPDLGRIVMLAPPNQGSEVTDNWRNVPGYAWLFGPAGLELGTDPESVPSRLGPLQAETGVIAGTRTINLILSLSLPNPDDGKVSVASTRVADMCAHLQVAVAHPFIMRDAQVIEEVLMYLATGRFRSADAEYPDCPFRHQESLRGLSGAR